MTAANRFPNVTCTPLRITIDDVYGSVCGLWMRPSTTQCVYVLAHGAGADMTHGFMTTLAAGLSAVHIATLRFQFPFTEAGRRLPDRAPTCIATVRAAINHAIQLAPNVPLIAGGKSMGGRMTSMADAEQTLPTAVRGLAFIGFPLHPANKPNSDRAAHLTRVHRPMLFVQGTRDRLAQLAQLTPIVNKLGERATLHLINSADHGFAVTKRSGRTDEGLFTEIVSAIRSFVARVAS